jgi:hypothetical protein
MTPEQFVYWLQGYFELTDDTDRLSKREHIIKDHLQEVFTKRTPDRTQPYVTPLEITPNGTGTPWKNPNGYEIIC